MLATVDVAYFVKFFDRFDLGKKGAVSLLSADGIMLARSPDDGTYVGRDLSNTPFLRIVPRVQRRARIISHRPWMESNG